MSPVLPSDTEAVVVNDSDEFCVAWRKFLKSLILYYRWKKYRMNEEGGIEGTQWEADLCAAVGDCPDVTP